jgi:predicted CXXCH cytochrome family protein
MKIRNFALLTAIAVFVLLPVTALAYWDGPHLPAGFTNDACSNCHVTNPHHSPPVNSWPSKLDELCQGCHYDGSPVVGPELTKQKTHSSRTTSTTYGNWEVDCWECHNPHGQEQDDQWGTTYGKYLRVYSDWYIYDFHLVKYIDPVTCTVDPWIVYCPPVADPPVEDRLDLTGPQIEFTNQNQFVDNDAGANDDICQVCHRDTKYYRNAAGGSAHPAMNTSDTEPGGNCITCHTHENGFRPGHGGADFAWNDTTKASCGTTDCHDWAGNQNVITDIHNSDCLNCHDNASGGAGTTVDKDVGFATNAGAAPHDEACTVCHTLVNGHTHHDRSDSFAANGTCTNCHSDPRNDSVVPDYPKAAQAKQLTCRACHVRVNGTILEVVGIALGEAGNGATGDASGNTLTALTVANGFAADHTFNNTNATGVTDAIDNYGICFECHGTIGRTGYDTAGLPVPYHALPLAGAYVSGSTTYIGGLGWHGNLNPTTDGSTFRGGLTWDTQGNAAYFPFGKGPLNLGYGQHSLAKGATNTMDYKKQNSGALDDFATVNPDLVFGIQTVDHLASPNIWAVPHFDAICNSGSAVPCDDITGASVTQVKDGGTTLGFNVTATSSTAATLHIIFGGVEIGSISSGGTLQFRYRNTKNQALDFNYCMDQFNAEGTNPIWIVSEDGGAVNAGQSFGRGTATGSPFSTPETCSRVTSYPIW